MVKKFTYYCPVCGFEHYSEKWIDAPFDLEHTDAETGGACAGKMFRKYQVPLEIRIGGKK